MSYQEVNGKRAIVASCFRLLDSQTLTFGLTGPYDPSLPLIIDPDLAWSTYLGGSENDIASGIAMDGAGNIYVTGSTDSPGWVSGGYDTTFVGNPGYDDVFVAKLSPTGAHLWSTYLGGDSWDKGQGIAVDFAGNVYVTGWTASSGWVEGGFAANYLGGESDTFVAKLSPGGEHLWSTYLGGGDWDKGYGIALDSGGDVYVTGKTGSSGWTLGGFNTSYNGGNDFGGDAFVAKLSSVGAHLWSTYLGGSSYDGGRAIAVDGSGNVYVTGITDSSGWVAGGFDTSIDSGHDDAFVAKLSPDGAHLWSTYLGGDSWDEGNGIAVDGAGDVYVTGNTYSVGWVAEGFNTSFNNNESDAVGGDAFVAKLSPAGAHLWSTYLGGGDYDDGNGLATDSANNIYVTGRTRSAGWAAGGFNVNLNGGDGGNYDAFVAKLSPAGAPLWSSYLGAGNLDVGHAIALDGAGNVIVAGETKSAGWVSGGFGTTYHGTRDGWVAKIAGADQICTSSLSIAIQPPVTVTAGAKWRCVGTTTWLDSGTLETGLSTGIHEIEFQEIPDWTKPENQRILVQQNQTANSSGLYYQTGSLRVVLGPAKALDQGAQWRRVGTQRWLDSGVTETAVPIGDWEVELLELYGWIGPDVPRVTILKGQLTNLTSVYARPSATLQSAAPNPTGVSPVPVAISFNAPVGNFDESELSLTNAMVVNLAGSEANYSFGLVPIQPGIISVGFGSAVPVIRNFNGPTSLIWVNFASRGSENGSQYAPFNTLAEGVAAVLGGGTVKLVGPNASSERLRLTRIARLEAVWGRVRVGWTGAVPAQAGVQVFPLAAPPARPATARSPAKEQPASVPVGLSEFRVE